MEKSSTVFLDLKLENRNRIFHAIREAEAISSPALSYSLQLSRPTVRQNLEELTGQGYIYPSGFQGNTGGRKAQVYSVARKSRVAIGLNITKRHITIVMLDLCGDLICDKAIRQPFAKEDAYWRRLGALVGDVLEEQKVPGSAVLGVGVSVPGMVAEDNDRVLYGKILDFAGMDIRTAGRYIPFPCRMYNDADAAGYAEVSKASDSADAFYISLGNNVGGAALIGQKVYKGKYSPNGEVGHMTVVPDGEPCYCGKKGCLEAYCNAERLIAAAGGSLGRFFEKLEKKDAACISEWKGYLRHLAVAIHNVRMLLGCDVILGGDVGAHMDGHLEEIKGLIEERNPFEDGAEYLKICQVKKDAFAIGSALPWIHDLWKTI